MENRRNGVLETGNNITGAAVRLRPGLRTLHLWSGRYSGPFICKRKCQRKSRSSRTGACCAACCPCRSRRGEDGRFCPLGRNRTGQRANDALSEVSGRVEAVNAIAGQRVEKGDVVVQLDNHVQRFAVDRASLAVDDAGAQVERFEALAARNTVSDVQLSNAVLELEKARLDLREAQDALARRAVTAPFSGEVGLVDVQVGDYITPASPVTSLDERRTLLIEFRVPERFANQIAAGQQISLATPALPGLELSGVVSGMDSRIDTVSRTLTVQGTIDNEADMIRPGMSFEVSMSFAGNAYPAVPSLAVQWDRQGSYVFKANGDVAERADISIVARQDGKVLVSGDIAAGDMIVSEGTNVVRRISPSARRKTLPTTRMERDDNVQDFR